MTLSGSAVMRAACQSCKRASRAQGRDASRMVKAGSQTTQLPSLRLARRMPLYGKKLHVATRAHAAMTKTHTVALACTTRAYESEIRSR